MGYTSVLTSEGLRSCNVCRGLEEDMKKTGPMVKRKAHRRIRAFVQDSILDCMHLYCLFERRSIA